MVTNPLLFIIFGPLLLGLVGLFLPNALKKLLGVAVLGYSLYLSLAFLARAPVAVVIGGSPLFELNALSRLIVLFLSVLGFLIFVYSLKNIPKAQEGKSLLLLLMSIGASQGVAASGNIVVFIIFWGISGLFLYLYALLNGPVAADAAKKTFLTIGGTDALLILGLAILSLDKGGNYSLSALHSPLDGFWSYFAFFSLFLAALAKAGGFPLHTWVPAFSEVAPIEGVALLPAAFDKLLGIYLLARVMTGFFAIPLVINVVVMVTGTLTIIIAVMMALVQHNGRKLLGYHAVSQVGYMILGLGTGSALGAFGGLFHMINHAIYKSNLFLSLGSVEKRTGTAELSELGGLGPLMPLTFISSLVGAFAISGLPPFNGFVSKWIIYQSLLSGASGRPTWVQSVFLLCLAIAVFGSGLTLASFMKFLYTIYFGKTKPGLGQIKEIDANNWLPTIALSVLCVFLGIFAFPVATRLLLPALGKVEARPAWPGFYEPYAMVCLLAVGFVVGLLGYLALRRVRFDRNYVGGQEDSDQFTVDGTHFYAGVRDMPPLRAIYDLAFRKYFDLYHWVGTVVHQTSAVFQALHSGLLPAYTLWTLGGFVLVVLALTRG